LAFQRAYGALNRRIEAFLALPVETLDEVGEQNAVDAIATTTGSTAAITLNCPERQGRLNGRATWLPLLNVSLTDSVFEMHRATTVEEVNARFQMAAETNFKGILGYDERPLVCADYTNNRRSSITDMPSTTAVNGAQLKVYAWDDTEWGYAGRWVDLALMFGGSP